MGGQNNPSSTEDEIRELTSTEVVIVIRGQIPEMFSSIKTTMIEYFNDRYAALSEAIVAAANTIITADRVHGERTFQCQDFNNEKPLEFDRFQDLIIAMRWLSAIKGCSLLAPGV